ncbi:MAG: ATP-dependent DNA helicase [Treponema sp.]
MSDFTDDESYKKLDVEKIAFLLAEGGALSKLTENYEVRENQLELVRAITNCYNKNTIGVFEAGTGIGKSFAYLIPSIKWAYLNNTRIIISTATINLQNQLINKDIPLAFKILGISQDDVKVALVKGRNNYLCLRKLEEKLNETQFLQGKFDITGFSEERKDLNILYEWSNKTKTGDREELKIKDELWKETASDAETCLGTLCPYFSKCFVTKMKQTAESSLIIVANHHLIFADVKVRMDDESLEKDDIDEKEQRMPSVLPAFKYLVFDEAHSIKKTAINFFSSSISQKDIKSLLATLYLQTTKKRKKGVIVELSYTEKDINLKEFEILQNALLESTNLLDVYALPFLLSSSAVSISDLHSEKRSELLERFKKLYQAIFNLTRYLSKIVDILEEDKKDEKHKINLVTQKLTSILGLINNFLKHEEIEDTVFWFEKRKIALKEEVTFVQTPLNVASILKGYLFSRLDALICVSATLQVGKNFGYYLNGVGLREESFEINKAFFPSPFLYEENVLLSVPNDIPFPNEKSFQDTINKAILSLIKATNGRALVLFTSYSSLIDSSEYVKQHIKENIAIYTQGEKPRVKLLEDFKNDISACLFATMSFWEGIDVPGEALTHLILVKLPFTVPDHPVLLARAKALEKRGFNSFTCLNLPEAVILFKQGFGRLIRTTKDMGVVTVLDKRLITKPYGKMFLDSIPKTIQCFASFEKIIYTIKDFIKQ